MKLIESSVTIIPQDVGLEGIYKQIEIAARNCYKSESFIKEGSAEKMINALIKRGHGSPLEHGTVYLTLKWWQIGKKLKYIFNKYSKIRKFKYVTTNYRVLIENNWLKDLQYLCEPTEYHEKRYTVRFICSRSIANEIVRHRVMSFCQESQRYVNYSLDKFGNEITYILPKWVIDRTNDTAETYDPLTGFRRDYLMDMPILEAVTKHMVCEDRAISNWIDSLKKAESDYFYLLCDECGLKPEEARGVLPNDCKTDIVVTGFASDWMHFFKLRTDNGAHPDMRELACPLEAEFKLKGFI
jgi:thymidylate synthase (FAD)